MFSTDDLVRLEAAVSAYIDGYEGVCPVGELEAQRALLVTLERARWILEKTPIRYVHGEVERVGEIVEFVDWDGLPMVRMRHPRVGLSRLVGVGALRGPV